MSKSSHLVTVLQEIQNAPEDSRCSSSPRCGHVGSCSRLAALVFSTGILIPGKTGQALPVSELFQAPHESPEAVRMLREREGHDASTVWISEIRDVRRASTRNGVPQRATAGRRSLPPSDL